MSETQRSDASPAFLPSAVSGGAIEEKERRRWSRPWRHALGALWLLAGAAELPAQTTRIRSAPPGVVETGVPTFTALGPEAIGLKSPPTDLHVLSDGRVLLFTRTELAIGDGQRWQVIRKAERGGDELGDEIDTRSVAVDADDSIYIAITGGFARVEFGEDGFWRLRRVAPYSPVEVGSLFPLPTQVVMTSAEWFWHSGSGLILSWRPGQDARFVVVAPKIERIFAAPGGAYVSNLLTNRLEPLHARESAGRAEAVPIFEAITCSAPLDKNHALLGTSLEGIKVFDGASLRPFVSRGLLAGGRRINDLCVTEPGLYAAALDMVGLVFFDRSGKIVQVLDHAMDYRLARVERVVYAAGVVWALSSDGIVRVQFPARVSNMEWLVPTALSHAQPTRFEGRLWLLADGRVQRGVYDELQRLIGFEDMSLPGRLAHMLSVVTGSLLATNEEGIYRFENDRWIPVATGIRDARIEVPSHDGRRWVYFARGEYGWLTKDGNGFSVQRIHDPRFDHVFLVEVDAHGDAWLELGAGKFGRARLRDDVPALEVFDHLHGPTDTWVNIFLADGEVRLNFNGKTFRFDERRRLVQDRELPARIPDLALPIGRPAMDPRGRLWLTARGTVKVLDLASGNVKDSVERMPLGLHPFVFTMEDDGVVWLHEGRRLARFDPSMPDAPETPLRAVIARLTFTARNRTVFNPPARLSPVAYADNAIALHFAAPGSSLGQPIVFDVKLHGHDEDWTATGAGGTAVFNHLKEGGYLLRVRPRAGALVGTEATLAFTVLPPWYRSPVAYFAYVLAGIVLAIGTVRGLAYLERRDRARLERLVVRRTAELNDTNRRLEQQVGATVRKAEELQVSEDRYRRLSAELEQRVAARTAELHEANQRLVESNEELEAFSYSVSHDLRAPLRTISGFAALLKKRADGYDEETRHFLDIVAEETVRLHSLIGSLLTFSQLIRADINHQPIELAPLIEAVRAELASDASGRAIEWRIGALPTVYGDPTLLRQVFANLLANALKFSRGREPAVIEIGALPAEGAAMEHILYVRDNGAGFDPKRADKLFGVFQRLHSSREFEGTGIGLATVRRIVGRHRGRVWAEGARGAGATFYFSLPQPVSAPEPVSPPTI